MASILVFGDSIAFGLSDPEGGWVDRIKRRHIARPLDGDNPHEVYNLGILGDTVNDVALRFETELYPRLYPGTDKIAVIAAGINDSRAKPNEDDFVSTPEVFRADLELLSENLARALGGAKVIFVGLTPIEENKRLTTGTSHYSNERVRMFDDILLSFCMEFEFTYVPVFDAFLSKGGADLLDADGLHPNAKGHALIEQLVSEQLDTFL